MATFEKCDGGCGAISPDEEGRCIDNTWLTVTVFRPLRIARQDDLENKLQPAHETKWHLCRKCFEKVEIALGNGGQLQ